MKIVSLDPGGTTGCVTYTRDTAPTVDPSHFEWKQFTSDHHQDLWVHLNKEKPEVVVIERFMYQRRELTRGVALNLDAVEYIGVVKLWHQRNSDVCDLFVQTPAQAKNFWSDDKLKALGLWVPGLKHAMDATRHLLYFLAITRGEPCWIEALRPTPT